MAKLGRACALLMLCAVTAIPSIAQTFTVLYSAAPVPEGGLNLDAAGNLYGATAGGGTFGWGTVFELSPGSDGTWNETLLFNMNDLHANSPQGPLIFDAAGNLYGATEGDEIGLNTVFELSPTSSGWTGTVLHTFGTKETGSVNLSHLIFDGAGNLYGTTTSDGQRCLPNGSRCGTVFMLSPLPGGGWQETDLYHFSGKGDGAFPASNAGLIMDSAGNLYGTTVLGGFETGICFPMSTLLGAAWYSNFLLPQAVRGRKKCSTGSPAAEMAATPTVV